MSMEMGPVHSLPLFGNTCGGYVIKNVFEMTKQYMTIHAAKMFT